MNFHRYKKGDELSSQEYDKEIKVQYKNKKTLLLENKSLLTCIMKRESNIPQDHVPSYDGGMGGNI